MEKIFIDPGHGDIGKDFGAIGKDGTREADIALSIGKTAKTLLEKDGYKVYMSREKEMSGNPLYSQSLGDLPYRTKAANDAGCDLFISIHCNASSNSAGNGTEI